jgi:hypothetical protein
MEPRQDQDRRLAQKASILVLPSHSWRLRRLACPTKPMCLWVVFVEQAEVEQPPVVLGTLKGSGHLTARQRCELLGPRWLELERYCW